MAILAASAASAFAADYTVVKSGEWYESGVFGEGVTAPVATSEETAIDNLRFASSGLSLKITGANSGYYFIKNLAGSDTEAQTVEIFSNSIWQAPHIANITGNENYRLTLNFGKKGVTTDNPGNAFLYTYLSDASSSSTFRNATVNIYSGFYGNNLSLKNASLNVERYYANAATASTFKSITLDKDSSLSINGGIYNGENIDSAAGSSIVIKNATLNCSGYINLHGNMEFTGEKGSLIAGGKIRIASANAVLTLHGSELLSGNKAGTSKMSMNFYESGKVVLGGNESLGYIATTISKSGSKYLDTNKTITFVLHEDTTSFSIDELYKGLNNDYAASLKGTGTNTDGTEFTWDIKYNFENFKNGVVRIGQDLTEEELGQIVADGWKDFTQNSEGYLFATQIPEPATCAVALGGLAIAFAFMRKTRKDA